MGFVFTAYDAEENVIDYQELDGSYLDAWKECSERVMKLKRPAVLLSGFSHATLEDTQGEEAPKTWNCPDVEMIQGLSLRQIAEVFKQSNEAKALNGEDLIDALIDYVIDAAQKGGDENGH